MNRRKIVLGIIGSLIIASQTIAQPSALREQAPMTTQQSISTEQLKEFKEINDQLTEKQHEIQEEMNQIVANESITPERYSEIMGAQMDPSSEVSKPSQSEKEAVARIMETVQQLQARLQSESENIIEASDMSMDEFMQIRTALMSDEKLNEKFHNL